MTNTLTSFFISLLSFSLIACAPQLKPSENTTDKTITAPVADVTALKTLVNFPLGVAVPAGPMPHSLLKSAARQGVVNKHFNSLTAENIMKMMYVHPEPEQYFFDDSDALVSYAHENNMIMHGHALVWHTQAPKWMNELTGTKAEFKAVLTDHITTVASHFSGKLASWDVVNEAFTDDEKSQYRDTIWYKNIGAQYIEMAFRLARAADEKADLYYNDYNISGDNTKLARVLAMVDDFQARNIPIDGIGFQTHINTDSPSIEAIKASFAKVVKRGIKVRISELDIGVNQSEAYHELTDEIAQLQRERYAQVVNAYIETVPPKLRGGITIWGITDSDSWIPGFKKRADWALLFTDDYQGKPALQGVAEGLIGLAPTDKTVTFNWFEYQGNDEIFNKPLAKDHYQNPIVAGFHPDPSITRKGDDYYMVNSSFGYVPGVPIFHSRDLVHWALIGHALTNEKQLKMNDLTVSKGIYAPTIRYHDGLFYMITTAVGAGGNFFVTAKDPAGEWSDPYWLPEIGGIDPDLFFDDKGKVYIAHNDAPQGEPLYQGHRAIWLWEYDMTEKKVIKESGRVIVNGGADISQQPIWIEGPHLYKINGWYYLLCAEGGTGEQHSEVVFRTRSLDKPFVPYAKNPVLTQRDLTANRANPITSTGHADMVQTAQGDWWAVFLGTRPYQDDFYNTGRETFLLPVSWQNEWPHILKKGAAIPYRLTKPKVNGDIANSLLNTDTLTGNFIWRDEFDNKKLSPHWNRLRSTYQGWYNIIAGHINLVPAPVKMTSLTQPVFLGRRQQHMSYQASAGLVLPSSDQVSAGLVAFQNKDFHYYLGVKKIATKPSNADDVDSYHIFLEQVNHGIVDTIHQVVITAKAEQQIKLFIQGDKALLAFAYQSEGADKVVLADNIDGKLLSTKLAGGFVGTMLGLHTRVESVK